MGKVSTYYTLTKPGIIYGNALMVIAGFFLASKGSINLLLLLATLVGVSLVIASACVYNNYIDRGIDKKMTRTKKRALVTGEVSGRYALSYGAFLGIGGFVVLGMYTNMLTVLLGVVAFFVYVVLYGIAKRYSIHGTLVGSVAGALPPVAGYTAVTGRVDTAALLLFVILVCWQMPHFYAIAIYRRHEYAAAELPVLPLKKGLPATKRQMFLYGLAFIVALISLTVAGYTGYIYTAIMTGAGVLWVVYIQQGFRTANEDLWARHIFKLSLMVLLLFCLSLSVDAWVP